jgi:hypothetical protein
MAQEQLLEKTRSAFYAQAVADAVDHPFEFCTDSPSEVRKLLASDQPLLMTQ